MNRDAVKTQIQKVIDTLHKELSGKAVRNQYKVGKAQNQALTDLGIIDLMPVGFGFADADFVIREARDGADVVMNVHGEGENSPSSVLYKLINAVEVVGTDTVTIVDQPVVTTSAGDVEVVGLDTVTIFVSEYDNQHTIGEHTVRCEFSSFEFDNTIRVFGWNTENANRGNFTISVKGEELNEDENVDFHGNIFFAVTITTKQIEAAIVAYRDNVAKLIQEQLAELHAGLRGKVASSLKPRAALVDRIIHTVTINVSANDNERQIGEVYVRCGFPIWSYDNRVRCYACLTKNTDELIEVKFASIECAGLDHPDKDDDTYFTLVISMIDVENAASICREMKKQV